MTKIAGGEQPPERNPEISGHSDVFIARDGRPNMAPTFLVEYAT